MRGSRVRGSSSSRAATCMFLSVLSIAMFLLGLTFRPLFLRATTPAATATEGLKDAAVVGLVTARYGNAGGSPSKEHDGMEPVNGIAGGARRPTSTQMADAAALSNNECEASVRRSFTEYFNFANRGDGLRDAHGPLKIAAFSRLWVPPIHGTGGMQYHALHLYSQLAARGHFVYVFVTGPPHGHLKKLFLSVNAETLHPEEAPDASKANLVVEQVPSDRNGEYSELWYANCLARFAEVNRSLPGGFQVAHSESWAGVPNVYQLGLQMLVTWHGSMLDWFRNEMNLIVHNFRMKGKMVGSNTASRMSSLGSSVAYETYMLLSVPQHIVISDSAAKDLREMNLIDPESIHLIYNGVNPQNFKPASDRASLRAAFLSERHVDPTDFIVGCGGRLDGIKGHHQLSQAMRRVLQAHKRVTLLVAGSGAESVRYESMVRDGLQVVMLGMLPQNKLAMFYQALDVFVDPFYQHHGLNTVMLEATLSGVPIIATRLASAQTTAPCEAYGRTFALGHVEELAAHVVHYLEHPEERVRVGRNVRERALNLFSSSIMAGSYESLFYQSIEKPKPLQALTGKVVCRHTYPAMCYREPKME